MNAPALNIQRLDFDPVTGDNPSEAFMKLDLDIGEIADAIDGDGTPGTGIDARLASVETVVDGIGNAATKNVGTIAGTVAAGDDSRILRGSFKNRLINGNFDLCQRGPVSYSNNFATGNAAGYSLDRWQAQVYGGPTSTGTATVAAPQQTFSPGQTAVPGGPSFYARLQATSVPVQGGGGSTIRFSQPIEDVRSVSGTYTYGMWMKADSARTVGITFYQNFGTGGSATVMAYQQAFPVTTNWTFYTFTFNVPSIAGKTVGANSAFHIHLWLYAQDNSLIPGMTIAPFGTFSTGAYLDMARAQFEPGPTPTDYEQRPLGIELMLCQRYYEKSYDIGTAPGTATSVGDSAAFLGNAANAVYLSGMSCSFKVTKRTTPTIQTYSTVTGASGKTRDVTNNTDVNSGISNQGASGFFNGAQSSASAGGFNFQWQWTADAEI